MILSQIEGQEDEITKDYKVTILWYSVSEHSKHWNVVVDCSMSKLISVEYEQDFCHFPSEMQIGDNEVSWWVEYYVASRAWPFFHSGIHDSATSIWILKMKKLVQDLVKHPYGQLCQLQQGEKNKDVPASSIRTLPAIQTAFASSEGNGSGELLKSLPTSDKLCKDKKSWLK